MLTLRYTRDFAGIFHGKLDEHPEVKGSGETIMVMVTEVRDAYAAQTGKDRMIEMKVTSLAAGK